MRSWLAVFIVAAFLGPGVGAQDPAANPQVNAATADAIESLKREVVAAHVTPDLTVADLIDRVGGGAELDKTLHAAEPLGGPRWLSDQFVQVRLTLDGTQVAKTLEKIVTAHPNRSPITSDALQHDLAQWSDRTFSATGTSAGAADVARLRPLASDRAWSRVGDADRRAALRAARDNAVNRVIESLANIPLNANQTLAPALANPGVNKAIKNWLDTQPVKTVEFGEDLVVRLTLSDSAEDLWPVLKSALAHQKEVPLPATQAEWDRLKDQVTAQVAPAIGSAPAKAAAAIVAPPPAARMPAAAPEWSTQLLESQATAEGGKSRLFTARKAESDAQTKLRTQIEALPLAPGSTVGAAAQRDPRIQKAVSKALSRARPSQVDYGPKGAVTVHMQIHLSDLWAELGGEQ